MPRCLAQESCELKSNGDEGHLATIVKIRGETSAMVVLSEEEDVQ